jgi:hypothetical protein
MKAETRASASDASAVVIDVQPKPSDQSGGK